MAPHRNVKKPAEKQKIKDVLRLRKKESKQKLKEKRARIVVRNLPFAATEENLREHFSKYGELTEVKMLKKEDDTLLGCAFIQFKLVQKAKKAKHYTDGKPFLDRNISVEFAMPKKEYEKIKVKEEVKLEDDVKVKEEPLSDNDEEGPTEIMEAPSHSSDKLSDIKDEDENLSTDDNEDEIEDIDEDIDESEEKPEEKPVLKNRPKVVSNDVSEGKTVFIKNVPFTATNEDLKKCMSQFGPIYYALICVDKFTEHSKGTAFVKFCNKEDAEKALQAGTELTLLGNVLDCHQALNRNDVHSKREKTDKKDAKDSRNLYLVKEGVIMAGSPAAEGVSPADMAKRLQLEQYKTQILRNLNMFVSRERLVIHNIPASWNDKKLRIVCAKYAGKGAKIKEAKIMRDLKNVDAKGVGKSKEFGFVTLDTYENALILLRKLNNNPNIFTKAKRPIVSFSIEKLSAIRSKMKRLERSKMKNSNSGEQSTKESSKSSKNFSDPEDLEKFSGIPAVPGTIKMRSKFKLTAQAKKHLENVKEEKKKKKQIKKTLGEKREEFTKQEKQKIVRKNDVDEFSSIVSKYKKTLRNIPNIKKKWYT